jgi:hypothetical protein
VIFQAISSSKKTLLVRDQRSTNCARCFDVKVASNLISGSKQPLEELATVHFFLVEDSKFLGAISLGAFP